MKYMCISLLFKSLDSHQLIMKLGPHEASIKSLSLHQSGQYLLVVTACDSVLWDINTNTRCKTLCGGESVGVQDVSILCSLYLFF